MLDYITIIALIWHRENVFNTHIPSHTIFFVGEVCVKIFQPYGRHFKKPPCCLLWLKQPTKNTTKHGCFMHFFYVYHLKRIDGDRHSHESWLIMAPYFSPPNLGVASDRHLWTSETVYANWVYQFQDKESSWWCQPICKNMLVKLDHFPQGSGWNSKNMWSFTTFLEKVGRKTTILSSYFIHPHQIHPHLSWALPLHQLKRVRCAHPMRMWPHPSNIPTLMARHGCNITHGSESWFFVQELKIHIVRFVQSLCSKRMRNL